MATLTASEVYDSAQRRLYDANANYRRWEEEYYLDAVNAGQSALATIKPEAFAVTRVITLTEGVQQTISADSFGLLRLTRNLGMDGLTPGRAIREANIQHMDASNPSWTIAPASSTVTHFMRAEDKTKYYVYPPVPASPAVQVELIEARSPARVTSGTDVLTCEDIFRQALAAYVCYYILSMETTDETAFGKAQAYYNEFLTLLGAKVNG